MLDKSFWWWRNPESNWGHKDFQSSALPTELFRRITKDIENANFRDWVNGITSRRPKPCDQYSLIKCSDRGVRGRGVNSCSEYP